MPKAADVKAVSVTLEVGSQRALFVLLAADGTINRMGDGTPSNRDNDLHIGVAREPIFSLLMAHLTDEMLLHLGAYDIPEKRGFQCDLSIALQFGDGSDNGFGFKYGSDSEGPPREIAEFVQAAIHLTDEWHRGQKKATVAAAKKKKKKPWWKFW